MTATPGARKAGILQRLLGNRMLMTSVKLVLAAALLYWVCSTINWQDMRARLATLNWWWFALGATFQCVVILIAIHRLQILLRAQGVLLSYLRTLKYASIGLFFNVMLPGGAGGDVLKIYYVAREVPDRKPEIITAVLLDRCMGLVAVVTIAACALIATAGTSPQLAPLAVPAALVLLAVIAGGVLVATRDFWRRYAWWRWAEERMPRFLRAMIDALHRYRNHKAAAATALLESFTLQLLMCVIALCFGAGLRLTLAWYQYFVVFPIIAFVLNIPATPSGVGTTEWVSSELFAKLGQGSDAGFAFMILFRLNILLAGVPGLVLYLLPGTRVTRAALAAGTGEIEEDRTNDHNRGGV